MNQNRFDHSDDDYFADTRMSFGDHIEDLRTHLIRALIGFGIGIAIAFPIAYPVLQFINAPVEAELQAFHERRQQRKLDEIKKDPAYQPLIEPRVEEKLIPKGFFEAFKGLEVPEKLLTKDGKNVRVPFEIYPLEEFKKSEKLRDYFTPPPTLRALRIEETFMVYVKVAVVTGLVISCPWVFYQIWAFIAAGLYPHEKRLINVYLPISVVLFILGVVFCEIVVIPRAINALLWFNEWLNIEPELRLTDWLGFAIIVPLLSGISFQTPVVMMFLNRVGIANIDTYKTFRKYAYLGMALAAAVFSPTGDAYTMLLLWVPMIAFYELGIWLCKLFPGQPLFDLDIPDPDEMIEV